MAQQVIADYFSRNAQQWGRHYRQPGIFLRLFDAVFRRGLRQRWDITMQHAAPIAGKTFLDIGCGTGDYSLALAQAGAARVRGIDIAQNMIEICRSRAVQSNLRDRCEFVLGDFREMEATRRYDMVFAVGVFDYIERSDQFLAAMVRHSRGIVLGSFPRPSLVREPLRRFRYRRKGIPVYFYSAEELKTMAKRAGCASCGVIPYSAGYALIGKCS